MASERYILYSLQFMERIKDKTHTDWSSISILAHEIGHHLSGHTLDGLGSRPKKELEADRFSGSILQKMGATLDQATVNTFSEEGSRTHPGMSARVAAVTNGWKAAKKLDTKIKDDTPAKITVTGYKARRNQTHNSNSFTYTTFYRSLRIFQSTMDRAKCF